MHSLVHNQSHTAATRGHVLGWPRLYEFSAEFFFVGRRKGWRPRADVKVAGATPAVSSSYATLLMVSRRALCSCRCLQRVPPLPRLEGTRLGEALDRFDLCVVLGDALGCQMWIVEARSHDDSDTLDCSGFHVVDAVRLRTTVACQPDDRWRNSLNRHGGFSLCFRHAGSRGRVHPRVPDWRNGVHENAMLCTFNCKNAHQSDHCALGRRIGGLATNAEQADD